jgi:GT2 family glycosyltransferase
LPAIELVVMDNGSTDGSAEIVESRWPGARVTRLGRNTGYAAAADRGIGETRGEYVALLNYDLRLQPGYLVSCLEALDADPGLGSAQGLLLRPGDAIVDSAGHAVSRGSWFRSRGEGRSRSEAEWAPAQVFGVTAAAAVYRRAMLEDVRAVAGHYLEADFFAYYEDVDLDWRARWRGWRAEVVAGAVATHMHSGSGGRHQAWVQRHIVKNRLLVIYRNIDSGSLLLLLPWIAAQLAARLLLALVSAPSSLLGVGDFIGLVPRHRAVRRRIRMGRTVSPRSLRAWFGAGAS